MDNTTVFLIDDDASVRDSLSLLLSLKGMRTQVFASAEGFLETYRSGWRGCVLTDLRMPGMSGLELLTVLHQRGLDLPVVVLTAHGDVTTTRAALKVGAFDFLEKPVNDEVLIDVLCNAVRVDQEQHGRQCTLDSAASRMERLTPRELEVFERVTDGLQNRAVAERLGISPRTVEVYKARIMEKLRCRNLAEAVKLRLSLQNQAQERGRREDSGSRPSTTR